MLPVCVTLHFTVLSVAFSGTTVGVKASAAPPTVSEAEVAESDTPVTSGMVKTICEMFRLAPGADSVTLAAAVPLHKSPEEVIVQPVDRGKVGFIYSVGTEISIDVILPTEEVNVTDSIKLSDNDEPVQLPPHPGSKTPVTVMPLFVKLSLEPLILIPEITSDSHVTVLAAVSPVTAMSSSAKIESNYVLIIVNRFI